MWERIFLAGKGSVGTLKGSLRLKTNEKLILSAGVVQLISLVYQLHKELILVGIGIRIHDWAVYLGYRGIFAAKARSPLVEEDKETDEGNLLLWRLQRGVAEGSAEIPKGEAIPLEYNLAGLNSISFEKGCYIGQELIARTHHRGVIRNRLIPVQFLNSSGNEVEQRVSPGLEVIDNASKKKAGTITTGLGSRGLTLLRVEDSFKETSAFTLKDNGDITIKTIRPEWWPSEWFHQQ